MFIHSIRRLGSFLGFKIPNLIIFRGFQKTEYFGGMKILWYLFGSSDSSQERLYAGAISMHFMVSCLGQGTEWGYFWGLVKFQIFLGVLEIPYNFGGER